MNTENDTAILAKLELLKNKFNADGQDISTYLDGLYRSRYLNYWEYIRLDTLLSLQSPQTNYHDEQIFVIYHQIAELYFKLIINEFEFLAKQTAVNEELFLAKLKRINLYWENINKSMEIIYEEMSRTEFMEYRSALFPASGFQSVQFRMIEIASTCLQNITDISYRESIALDLSIEEYFEYIYWKKGSIDKSTGQKTLTLRQFEEKYSTELIAWSRKYESFNLLTLYTKLNKSNTEIITLIETEMRKIDVNMNIKWAFAHLKAASKHLKDVPSTGGTHWQKYLPPTFQKTIFYPTLWSKEEIDNWGRSYLM